VLAAAGCGSVAWIAAAGQLVEGVLEGLPSQIGPGEVALLVPHYAAAAGPGKPEDSTPVSLAMWG
jgi:hypothetical protein